METRRQSNLQARTPALRPQFPPVKVTPSYQDWRLKIIQAVTALLTLGLGIGRNVALAENPSLRPPFMIQQQEERTWLVRPNGERFFSLGVCCVNQGASRQDFHPANPAYAAWQHYADSNLWAQATLKRLKAWGFAPVVHTRSTAGAPWWDMWDPKITDRMDLVAREQILALREDPRLIGYYTDNEIGWWNAILFKMTLEQAPSSGQRRRLIEMLRQTYRGDWSELLTDFDPAPGVDGWDVLTEHGLLFLRPGGSGMRVERRFLEVLAERYYSLVHDIIRKYDQRALILGDRYPSFYYPEVARAAAQYVDAISSNLNASWNDGSFARFYLETLHRLTGKPVLIGEFYMSARDNQSGNKNDHGAFPVVGTQQERAAGLLNTLEVLLKTPYVVGADWFQYYDEPPHGRYDGENFNFGLVDIDDRPYEPLTTAVSRLDLARLKEQPRQKRLDASQGVPPASRNALAQFEPDLALKHWDRERGFVPSVSECPLADLYICWSRKSIYLGLYAQDVTEDICYRDQIVRANDRAEWLVTLNGSANSIQSRIGAGLEPIANNPNVHVLNISGLNGNVRNIACMEVPAKLFGKDRFKAGDVIEFSSSFSTQCRVYRTEWKGRFTLASR